MVKAILVSIVWVYFTVSNTYAESGVIHINPSVGYMKFDGDSDFKRKALPIIGVEYMLSDTYGVSVALSHADVNARDVRENVSVSLYYVDALYYLPHDRHWRPFLAAGVGHRLIELDTSSRDTQLHVGGGVRYDANNLLTFRSEVRVLQNLNNDETDALLTLGVSKAFGG